MTYGLALAKSLQDTAYTLVYLTSTIPWYWNLRQSSSLWCVLNVVIGEHLLEESVGTWKDHQTMIIQLPKDDNIPAFFCLPLTSIKVIHGRPHGPQI